MSGINLKSKAFLESLRLFEDEKKVDPQFVLEILEEAIIKTYQKHLDAPEARVRVDMNGSAMHVYHQLEVVDDECETFDDTLDILLEEAKTINPDVQIGDTVEIEVDFKEIGRTSINVAKQMLKQKIKEHEKERVYDEYHDKETELINGIVKTVEDKFVLIDIKNTIGIMLKNEQIPGETYREGQSIRTIIKEVSKNSKGSQVVLSRADSLFVKRLFEKEVPEIAQGIVEIKAIAREAGERTKMAVYSRNDDVDPIGACIGPRGSRVQAVISEVKGEKIDVFQWNDDIGELVKNSLSPAEVKACFYSNPTIDPSLTMEDIEKAARRYKRPLCVVVDDDKLSVAIGKKGKNAKLAVKLTDRKIDIKTVSDMEALGIDIDEEVAMFRADQARIAKEKEAERFQKLQEEALRKNEEFEKSLQEYDTGFDEEAIEEMDTVAPIEEEVTHVELIEEENKEEIPVEADAAVSTASEEKAEEVVEETKETEKKPARKPLVPKPEYKSKFEEYANASKKEETVVKKKRKSKGDDDRRVRAEDLQKKDYSEEFKPVYSDEELEEIEEMEAALEENSWINDDEIDFDEYDDYYEED